MDLTLEDVLEAEVVRSAKPQVLHGQHLLGRSVRWVHTSEIYEIAPLLRGGEILIISGLGLVGADPASLTTYIDRLADRSVSALFFELGRSFDQVPPAVVAQSVARDLPLVALHDVVPFVDVTYAVHRLLLRRQSETVVWIEEMDRFIHGALLNGDGMQELLKRVQVLADGAAVELRDASDGLIASVGDSAGAAHRVASAKVLVKGQGWGQVHLHGTPSLHLQLLARRAALAIGVLLVNAQSWAREGESSSTKLLLDIVRDRFVSAEELAARARAVGFDYGGGTLIGLAMTVDSAIALPAARAAVEDLVGRPSLVADVDGEIVVATAMPDVREESIRLMANRLVTGMAARPAAQGGGRIIALAAGPPVPNLVQLGGSLLAAREARELISRLGLETRVVLSSEIAVYRLLLRFSSDPELERFVSELLGPLMDHDASHGTHLLGTLEALAAAGWSKTQAASRLGRRRQTVYRHIAEIEPLIVGSIDDAECRAQLSLALKARLVRTVGSAAHRHVAETF